MQNLQIYPSKQIVIATDKLKKKIFDANYKDEESNVLEDKKLNLITPLDVIFTGKDKLKQNLTGFDELVFDICASEQFKGNEYTTPAIIHRAMGGSKTNFTAEQKDKILQSIKKLALTWIDFDCTKVFEKFGYNDGAKYKYEGHLLPSEIVTKTIGGQTDSAVIHFLRKTPLLDVAQMKGQIITCDVALLDVPSLRNTDLVLAFKGYLLRWILQIKGSYGKHKAHLAGKTSDGKPYFKRNTKLQKIIKFDTLFEQCGLSDADKWQQQDARKIITKILEHFKAEGVISKWEFTKKDGKFYSITFDFK